MAVVVGVVVEDAVVDAEVKKSVTVAKSECVT